MKTPNPKKRTRALTEGALTASLYVVFTFLSFGLSSGMIQCRLSEALCVLPCFTPSAIPGLAVGCLLANFVTGAPLYDVVFGTLATLIGALGAYFLRKRKFLAPIPNVLANSLIVPLVLSRVYGIDETYWFLVLTVGIGEVIASGIGGVLLYIALDRNRSHIFR